MCLVNPRHSDRCSRLVDDDCVRGLSEDRGYEIVRRLGETTTNPLVCEITNANKILTPCASGQTLRSPNRC